MKEPSCGSGSKTDPGTVDTGRFTAKLDGYYRSDDLAGAGAHLDYWESEARRLGDRRALLTVLSERLGYSRRTGDREGGLRAAGEAGDLLRELAPGGLSGGVVRVNIATTLGAFGRPDRAVAIYAEAERIFAAAGAGRTYEYAALLNNKAASLCDLGRTDEAEECMNGAIGILEDEGRHDGEIAVSLVSLAHLLYDRDGEAAASRVESILDRAWECVNSPRQPRDANYAFILTKCAPAFRYFKREDEARAMEDVAADIYGGAV